jgi:hypothetical protein
MPGEASSVAGRRPRVGDRMTDLPEIGADATLDDVDQDILDGIAEVYSQIDPVPDDLVVRSQFAITLDALHAEVAELQRWEADTSVARAEAPTEVETITFSGSSLTTMVTINQVDSETVRIDGWSAPGAQVQVELRLENETRRTVADDDGRFVFEDVPHGLAQFLLRPVEGVPVITPSVQL